MKYTQSPLYREELQAIRDVLELINYRPRTIDSYLQSVFECCLWLEASYDICIWRSKKERRLPRKGELCRRRREYKPPEMGVYDAPAGG